MIGENFRELVQNLFFMCRQIIAILNTVQGDKMLNYKHPPQLIRIKSE